MLQTDHDRWTYNHKEETETSENKKPEEEEKFHQLKSVTIQRKIYPNDQAD